MRWEAPKRRGLLRRAAVQVGKDEIRRAVIRGALGMYAFAARRGKVTCGLATLAANTWSQARARARLAARHLLAILAGCARRMPRATPPRPVAIPVA